MSSLYNYVRSTLSNKVSSNGLPDFSSFHLISKLPSAPYYNNYKFIPTLHKTEEKPEEGKYFNHTIGCADDLVYFATKECDNDKNAAEFRALEVSMIESNQH